jgi:hypothetical protein
MRVASQNRTGRGPKALEIEALGFCILLIWTRRGRWLGLPIYRLPKIRAFRGKGIL